MRYFFNYLLFWVGIYGIVDASQYNAAWKVRCLINSTSLTSREGQLLYYGAVEVESAWTPLSEATLTVLASPYRYSNYTNGTSPKANSVVFTNRYEYSGSRSIQWLQFSIPEPKQDFLITARLGDLSQNFDAQSVDSQGLVVAKDAARGTWAAREIQEYDLEINQQNIKQLEDFNPDEIIFSPVVNLNSTSSDMRCDEKTNFTVPGIPEPLFPCRKPPSSQSCYYGGANHSEMPCNQTGWCNQTEPGHPQQTCHYYHEHLDTRDKKKTTSDGPIRVEIPPPSIITTLKFYDRNMQIIPARGLWCVVASDVYVGNKKVRNMISVAQTNHQGVIEIIFKVNPKEEARVRTLNILLHTENFNIVTWDGKQFISKVLTYQWDEISTKALLTQKSYSTIWPDIVLPPSVQNRALMIFDAYYTIVNNFFRDVYDKKSDQRKVSFDILYPGYSGSAFFVPTFTISPGNSVDNYISLPVHDAYNPTVMAQHFGYLAMSLARGPSVRFQKGNPSFCGEDNRQVEPIVAFEHGYALGLGMKLLAGTPLLDSSLGYAVYVQAKLGEKVMSQDIENFACGDHFMNRQMGRIAAALFDLVDPHQDAYNPADKNLGYVGDGFSQEQLNLKLSPQLVLWDLIKSNPRSMQEYWYALQKRLLDDFGPYAENKAWAIFEYNWAHDDLRRNA